MRLRLIHRERSDYAGAVRDFIRELNSVNIINVEDIDPDSAEGADVCRLHGIVQYPAVVITTDDGSAVFISQGLPLPLVREVQYYAR